MFKRISSRAIFVLIISLVMSGCSTFVVRDTFSPIGNEKALIDYKAEDVELRVRINPDIRFYSIGILGMPVVPTYFNTSNPTEISLAIDLTLRHHHNFSFASQPCLIVEHSSVLCPYKLEVSTVGMYQDDGSMHTDKQKRWQKIPNFYKIENKILNLPKVPESSRINRQQIYQHYGYTGAQKWDYLRVDLTYKYKCEKSCPKRLKLNAKDLIIVGNLLIPNRIYHFEKTRQKDYHFATPVQ